MSVDKATVRHIAKLARIGVEDADLETLAGELSQILDWVEQLSEVDTEGVVPMAGVGRTTLKRRADAVTDGGHPEEVLANAPGAEDGFYTVPKVVE
jgi:aspartyl-tRNA(Asn)/glutamyl-tRNA(Gln) amidotransferase subunit C